MAPPLSSNAGPVMRQIFVSYARDDDEPPPGDRGAKGFVSYLHDQLRYELKQLGEPYPQLWRDTKRIERGHQFGPDLMEALADSSLLLVVLSRNWMAREWCRRELDEFIKLFPREAPVDLRERIVIVGKNEVATDERPEWLRGQEGYNLFWIDSENGEENDFFVRGEVVDARYLDRLRELARYIWRQARKKGAAKAGANGRESQGSACARPQPAHGPDPSSGIAPAPCPKCGPEAPSSGRTVFLSKPAADMVSAYDTLVCELAGRGYRVVPDPTIALPTGGAEATQLIADALSQAELSVHLVGQKAGFAPDGERPIVQLQLARAAQHVGSAVSDDNADPRRFHRIIWVPRALPEQEIACRDPAKALAGFCDSMDSDQVIGSALVDLRQFVIQHLEKNAPRPSRVVMKPTDGMRLYIQHPQIDVDFAVSLAEELHNEGFSAWLPAFDGEETERKSLHSQYLTNCDAVVLCWANASEVWIRSNANELNWERLGREAPFRCRTVVAGPPPRQPKNIFRRIPPRTDVDLVIDATEADALTPELLRPLLQMLTSHA